MDFPDFYEEAERTRQQAFSYLGKPEAPFLLRIAREFERLAVQGKSTDRGDLNEWSREE